MVGCQGGSSEKKEGTELVKVNGDPITQEEMEMQIFFLDPQTRAKYQSREGLLKLLDDMVTVELLYQEAKNKSSLKDNPQVQYQIERMTKDILINELIRESIDEGELYRMFLLNYRRARVIFARTNENDPASREIAKKRMESIYARLKKGEDFGTLAKTESDVPNPEQAGEIGYVDRDVAMQIGGLDFQNALFDELKAPGDYSKPFEGKYGYFIVQLLEDQSNLNQQGFTDSIKARLIESKKDEITLGYINDLKSRPETKIDRNNDNIRAFIDKLSKQIEEAQGAQGAATQSGDSAVDSETAPQSPQDSSQNSDDGKQ